MNEDCENIKMEHIWNYVWLPTITKTLIDMIDDNRVPSFGDNSIIIVKNSTNKKEEDAEDNSCPWIFLANVISKTNIINIKWNCKKLSTL